MTPVEVRERVEAIRLARTCGESRPGRDYMEALVSRLWQDTLEAVANGAPEPATLAYEALKTRGIYLGPVGT